MISRSVHSVFFQIFLAVIACISPVAIAEQETPNIVFIFADDWGCLIDKRAFTHRASW